MSQKCDTGHMDTTTATAAKVEQARERAGISRLALSEATGIPRSTLIRKLNGHQSFTVGDIDVIAQALRVDPATLVAFKAVA